MSGVVRVHLDVPMEQTFGPEIALGVSRFALASDRQWLLSVPDWQEPMPETTSTGQQCSDVGIITRAATDHQDNLIADRGIPAVNVSGVLRSSKLPRVQSDDHACGVLAAEHLIDRGYTRFAAAFIDGQVWRDRAAGFAARVRRQGHHCTLFRLGSVAPSQHGSLTARLAEWLERLPEPTGVLAVSDLMGRRLSDACRLAGLRVPDRVALIGVDNSELMCHLADPPLTSVDINAEQIGFNAAAILDRLLRGEPVPTTQIVPPRGVIARASTDALAVDDPDVAEALATIQARACDPLDVETVLQKVAVSRRTLESRMRKAIGRTPGQEIKRVRLQTARDLLVFSDASLQRIARRTGYQGLAAFSHSFKQHTGLSPGQYRLQFRSSDVR
ncbi:MAG: substrate-binding domain-containing protein [Planctomycetota bacterium]